MTEDPALGRWRWTITAAFGLGGITISAWGPRLPAIKATLGIGTQAIGLLLAGVTVGAILGLVASVPVSHRLGGRRSVTAALLVIAAAMAVMGVALTLISVPLVAVAFVIAGLGVGSLDAMINVEGAAVEQSVGRTLMPVMHGAWSVGAAAGSGIGAVCAAIGIAPSEQLIGEAVGIAAVALWMAPGGVSMGFPLGMSAAAETGPDPAVRVSVVASIGYFANLAGPPVIGMLAQSLGILRALWLIAALFLAAFAVAGSLRLEGAPSSAPTSWAVGRRTAGRTRSGSRP